MSHRDSFTEDYEFNVQKTENGGYSVTLPHQCDDWDIIAADIDSTIDNAEMTDDYPNLPKSKELAISQMELFIKRASEALEKLKQLK